MNGNYLWLYIQCDEYKCLAILVSVVKWYLPVISMYGISLIPSKVECLFICLLFYSIILLLKIHLHALKNQKRIFLLTCTSLNTLCILSPLHWKKGRGWRQWKDFLLHPGFEMWSCKMNHNIRDETCPGSIKSNNPWTMWQIHFSTFCQHCLGTVPHVFFVSFTHNCVDVTKGLKVTKKPSVRLSAVSTMDSPSQQVNPLV